MSVPLSSELWVKAMLLLLFPLQVVPEWDARINDEDLTF